MKKKLFVLGLALLMAFSVVACAAPAAAPAAPAAPAAEAAPAADAAAPAAEAGGDTFRLGCYFQLTGGNSAYGIEARNSVLLGVKEINAAGGLNGKQIETVIYDTQGSPEEAVKVVTKMIENDNIDACIGSINSGDVLAAAPYLNEAGIYHLGLGTAASWMQEDWPYVFRPTMNNNNATPICAQLLVDLGYKTVGILNGQDDAAFGTANSFEEAAKAAGVEVVAREAYDAGDTDFSAQIAKVLSAKPDCIYLSVIGEAGGPFVRQIRQAGYKGIIFDKESFMSTQIEIAGAENSNYIAFANPYVTYATIEDCDIPNVKEFLQKYFDEYGIMVATDSAYRGYDAMTVVKAAAEIAGTNESDALRDATHKVVTEGLGGTLDFTSGTREGYEHFNSFILINGKNQLWNKWMEAGGYDAYLAETGSAK